MYLNEPLFIVIDGPDGCGKTTLIRNLERYLRDGLCQPVTTMRALGQGKIGTECRNRHLAIQSGPGFESLMMPMSIMEAYYDHVLPALANNSCVLMDRWVASFFAYQVNGREDLYSKEIYETLFDDNRTPLVRQPDLYFIGQVDQTTAAKRLDSRNGETNYLDNEVQAFKDRVAVGFTTYAKTHQNVVTLDCNKEEKDVFLTAKTYIDVLIEQHGKRRVHEQRVKAQRIQQEAQA